ncbi:MAG: CBS domain-containing protein [Deltaproteobacteria bacterium]|nr:CBS domain-containing protein [Deltaproteobacteria bacterium]
MRVKDWMTPNPLTLTEQDKVKTAVVHVLRNRIRHVPIVRDGKIVGIVTDRDLKRALPSVVAGTTPDEYQSFMDNTTLNEIMTQDPIVISPDADILEAVRIFVEHKFGALPVVENGQLVAIISQTDALRAFLKVLEDLGDK